MWSRIKPLQKKIWSTRKQWQRTPQDTQHKRGGEASDSLDFCHHTSRYRPHRKQPESWGHFYRCRLKPDTSPVLSRDLLAINPTANSFPSRLIPPYSPFLDECRGSSSCGNWYNVANQQQRGGNPGGGAPVGLNCHTPRSTGFKTWNWIDHTEWTVISFVCF